MAAAGQALPKAVALKAQPIYLSPDATSAKVGQVQPGLEIAIQAASHDFVQVFVASRGAGVSGWIANQGYARFDDPEGAEVVFGAGVQFENLAESQSGEEAAALDAARLYTAVSNDFPSSPRAAEAAYRGAYIPWELHLSEEPHRRTPEERQFPDDTALRKVEGKFRGTPWAARAAFQLIVEHFTCGSWFDKPQCVEKEMDRYRDYVKQYPAGPFSAQAAFDALYRAAAAWTLYQRSGPHHDEGKAAHFRQEVADQAATLRRAYPATDWAARAALLAFNVAHGTPVALPAETPLGGP